MVTSLVITAALLCKHGLAMLTPCKAVEFPLQELEQLNQATGKRVFAPQAPAAICYGEQEDKTGCGSVAHSWKDHAFHANDAVSTMWNQFNNDTCLPRPEGNRCDGSGYPAHVLNATTREHVQLGVNFAKRHNIRLNVKNTGHDYLGRSNAPNSLSIWMRHMKAMSYSQGPFTPQGCQAPVSIDGPTTTIGAGVQMWELYEFLQQRQQTFVGGAGRTVGVAGYVLGGGHSILSGQYGLGADQVLEMEVVTPDGEIRTVNECQDPDLFWALRGGGGSTFGILTSLTMKTYPSPRIVATQFSFAAAPKSAAALQVSTLVWTRLPDLVERGANGYMFSSWEFPNPQTGGKTSFGGTFGSLAIVGSDNMTRLNEALALISDEVKRRGLPVHLESRPEVYPNVMEYLASIRFPSPAGRNMYMGSRLLSADKLRTGEAELRLANEAAFSRGLMSGVGALVVGGPGLRDAAPRGGSNAVNPGWRTAVASLFATADFAPHDGDAKASAVKYLQGVLDPLRRLDPASGCYSNEALPAEPQWRRAFWGANYQRLARIKRKYDPDNVFWCRRCVGNSKLTDADDKLCEKPDKEPLESQDD